MNSNLKLTNRKTGVTRIVSLATWDFMQRDGRSRFWTPEPLNQPEKVEIRIKEKVTRIERINIEPVQDEPVIVEPVQDEPVIEKEYKRKSKKYEPVIKEEEEDG